MPNNYTKRSGTSKKKKFNGVRAFQWGAVIVLFAALIFVLSLLLKNPNPVNIPQNPESTPAILEGGHFKEGTTVNGVDIGGMSPEEARTALTESVNTQLEGVSVTLAHGSSVWTADASSVKFTSDLESVLAKAMEAGAGAYHTAITADRASLSSFVQSIAAEIDRDVVEPTLTYNPEASEDSLFTVSEGQSGLKVDVEATVDAVLAQLASDSYGKVSVVVNEVAPTTSASELTSKVTLIASFTTEFETKEAGRTHNLNLACQKLSGISIADGETFSFNDVVGPRDEANGWKEAHVIIGGTRYEDGWGGGICQVSTTLYNALLRTGIDFSSFSRVNHSIPSGYVERGLDATVAYGSKDFKFKNTSGSTIYIVAYASDLDKKTGKLTFKIYGQALPEGTEYKVYSKTVNTLEPPEPEIIYDPTEPSTYKVELQKERKGYVVEVYREKFVDGVSQGAEKLYTDTYKPVQGIYTIGSAVENAGGSNVDIPEIPDDELVP